MKMNWITATGNELVEVEGTSTVNPAFMNCRRLKDNLPIAIPRVELKEIGDEDDPEANEAMAERNRQAILSDPPYGEEQPIIGKAEEPGGEECF